MDQAKLQTLIIQEISGVDDPANQLPGWMVQKARTNKQTLLGLADKLRKALGEAGYGDDEFVAVVQGRAIPWVGHTSHGLLVKKAALRHAATGRFTRDATTTHDGITWTHTNSHPLLMAAAGHKFKLAEREPADDGGTT